ncbi:MAG TPA: 1-acyl-sn-glycerol-3-phosphate acyltransferase [Bryobacteraceae bacterium]|nr:1-acyl-sn-glycerol-3-phosphate acyltransferase [Bryobacteraceae bacterium]
MKVMLFGRDGALRRQTEAELGQRGIVVGDSTPDCVICLDPGRAREAASLGGLKRLVLRSHAYVYGSNAKNPGLMTEDRVSLLPANAPEQRWLQAEEAALQFPNTAVIRLTSLLDPEEGDLIVKQISGSMGISLAGFNPSVQFISVRDAARALASAAQSEATGIFNAAGEGAIPLNKLFRAAGTTRISLPGGVKRQAMQFNWTVSGEKAERELGFKPDQSTVEALAEFLGRKSGSRPDLLAKSYDDYGLDTDYIRAWGWWFEFVRKVYWRIELEGMENVPQTGAAMYVSNHRGFIPIDAVMHLHLLFTERGRIPRFLIIPSLLRTPYMCNFLTKLGGVIASQENAARLFKKGELIGIFPEGIRGTFTPYKRTYKLRDFAKSAFAKIAIENQVPIIPSAVIGHSEIFPIIGRIDSSLVVKELGWPYFPIAPPFPLSPIPIPSKWHVRVLPPVGMQGLKPADAENEKLVRDFSRHIQAIVQTNIDDMLSRRKSIFWGKVLTVAAPPAPQFRFRTP